MMTIITMVISKKKSNNKEVIIVIIVVVVEWRSWYDRPIDHYLIISILSLSLSLDNMFIQNIIVIIMIINEFSNSIQIRWKKMSFVFVVVVVVRGRMCNDKNKTKSEFLKDWTFIIWHSMKIEYSLEIKAKFLSNNNLIWNKSIEHKKKVGQTFLKFQ